MRHHAGLAASVRRAASAFAALLCLWALPALAGDRALIDFLGFSEDSRFFAFEEYGVQDGSGFAYSTIYVIDLEADKWVGKTPFRAQAADDAPDTPLADIRAEAYDMADAQLKMSGISEPTDVLALLGDGVAGADGKTLAWSTPACCGPGQTQDDKLSLSLETFPAGSPQDCVAYIGEKALGYALTFEDGQQAVELHRDGAKLPNSRGCPLDYRLYAVVQPFESSGPRVAIISSYPFGFEGPDRRFLAVPLD